MLSDTSTALAPVKFLLVDDVDDNLLALEALLKRDGLELLKAHNGREALELLLVHDVSLAFLDVQMPEMDGFELAELMRGTERTRNVPIIFVTGGLSDQGRMFRGYDAGAVDFLYKPVEPHLLRSKAETFFQLSRQRQQLEQVVTELRETLRFNEMFTAVLGHDLRNPLGAVLSQAELLLRKRSEEAAVVRGLERIRSSGKRMARMIDGLLDFARARLAGGIPIHPAPMDLSEVSSRVLGELRTASPDRLFELTHQGELRGTWDSDRLAQVMSNLLANAVKHGSPEKPVRLLLDGSSLEGIQLSVNNAGMIPNELRPHLFTPFRVHQEKGERSDGLGLGLFIVSHIAEAHGGRVEVDSNETEGTTMRVWLPRDSGPYGSATVMN